MGLSGNFGHGSTSGEHGQLLIADTTREPVLFWIFKCMYMVLFALPFSSISAAINSGAILLKANVSGPFQQFRSLLNSIFWSRFWPLCGGRVGLKQTPLK
jgi:hypothetical protein